MNTRYRGYPLESLKLSTLSIYHTNKKKKWRLGQIVSLSEVIEMTSNNDVFVINNNIEFKVIDIEYNNFKWRYFWRNRVNSYLLKVIKNG
jgi:hypothetical protein